MQREKLATASAAGMLGIICSIFLFLAGILFIGFGEKFAKDLAPLFSQGSLIAGFLSIIFGILMVIGGVLIYSFKYRIGGCIILFAAIVGTTAGGGFYLATLWGTGAGFIALICPNLEERIRESKKQKEN
ncbi:MAG: hypothetical protein HWN67_19355 [Candidatus Helarchaeota archaeon]|nr:hypothetical protein [Candidatus Helarchaeota archaeon]